MNSEQPYHFRFPDPPRRSDPFVTRHIAAAPHTSCAGGVLLRPANDAANPMAEPPTGAFATRQGTTESQSSYAGGALLRSAKLKPAPQHPTPTGPFDARHSGGATQALPAGVPSRPPTIRAPRTNAGTSVADPSTAHCRAETQRRIGGRSSEAGHRADETQRSGARPNSRPGQGIAATQATPAGANP